MGQVNRPLVLVVEDEPIVREMVCMDLDDAGFDTIDAGSGDEAIAILGRHNNGDRPISLLFTDISMPGKTDGWALAEAARALLPDLNVVYASGYSPVLTRAVPRSHFLSKPYRTSLLLKTIRSFVRP